MELDFEELLDGLHRHASIEYVYGDPIETDKRIVVPAARVTYGFGGGYGSGASSDGDGDANDATSEGEGAGFGGGLLATPVGAVEVNDDGSRFVEFGSRKRAVGIGLFALLVGYVLGRR